MKICFVCSEYPPVVCGGIGIVTQVLARALVAQGHAVRVIGVSDTGPESEDDMGVRVWRLRPGSQRFGWIRDRIALFRTVERWACAGEIDIVEVADWGGAAAFWPRLPVPVVARLHGSATYYAAELEQRLKRRLFWLESRSLHRADFLCSVSRHTAERTKSLFNLRSVAAVLYNPVTVPPAPAVVDRAPHRVVFTGTLVAKKGVVALIRAWPSVVAVLPDAELHLLGKDGRAETGGSMQQFLLAQLPAAVRPTVHFYGHVDREAVRAELCRARVGVFPSYTETFGLAPVEAMACGCPTIYTWHPPGPELVRDGVDGLLIDPDQPREIAAAILAVLTDDKLASNLGAAGAQRVAEKFSLPELVRANERFYQTCVDKFYGCVARQILPGWRKAAVSSPALADCSLVVATYRRPEAIVTLLTQLVSVEDPPGEVVIVDGTPEPVVGAAVAGWARRHDLPFALVYVHSPAGLTRQRNVGVYASTGAFVFFLDDDCLPQAGYFTAIRQVFASDALGRIGAVAGTPINELNQPLAWRWRMRFRLGLIPHGEPGRYYPMATSVPRALAQPFTGTRPTDVLPGVAFACRRVVLERCRFSRFFDGYSQGEDLEMSRRIARDWELRWCGDAHVIHQHAAGGRPASFAKGRMEVRNRYFIWRRHTPQPSMRCRLQMWADFLFIGLCDILRGEWMHGVGVACGAGECLVASPQYVEPPARREYEFSLKNFVVRKPTSLAA